MDIPLVLSWIGSLLFIAALLPQVYRTWQRGRANDLSVLFLVTLLVASGAMLVYAVSLENPIFAAGYVVNLIVWGYVLKVRLYPRAQS